MLKLELDSVDLKTTKFYVRFKLTEKYDQIILFTGFVLFYWN